MQKKERRRSKSMSCASSLLLVFLLSRLSSCLPWDKLLRLQNNNLLWWRSWWLRTRWIEVILWHHVSAFAGEAARRIIKSSQVDVVAVGLFFLLTFVSLMWRGLCLADTCWLWSNYNFLHAAQPAVSLTFNQISFQFVLMHFFMGE